MVEVVSPRDESYHKLGFYAAYDVDEVLLVDTGRRSVIWSALLDGDYRAIESSDLVDGSLSELTAEIDW